MFDLKTRVQLRLEIARLEVRAAYDRLAKEEKEATREKRPLPQNLRQRLEADIRDAKLAVRSAEASFYGVNRFPPIARGL